MSAIAVTMAAGIMVVIVGLPILILAKLGKLFGFSKNTWIWIVVGFGLLIAVRNSLHGDATPVKTSESSAEAVDRVLADAALDDVIRAVKAIRSGLRDPDSLVLERVYSKLPAKVICIDYRAKNGFGGYNRALAAYVAGQITDNALALTEFCTGHGFHDYSTWAL